MWRHRALWWVVAYLAFSAFLVAAARPNLANFPPVGADEAWIMSVSYKVANDGILGSDLYEGFHGADRHYFFALPAHHFIQAAFFKTFGAGVAQARAPSLLAAVVILCAVGWLAYKWGGVECSVAAGILLLFWRSNLIATDPRPPLLALAQSGRYDVTVLACWWLVILTLNRHLDQPRRVTAIVCGLLAGAAALTHFYGVAVLVCCAATLLWISRQGKTGPLYARDGAIAALIPISIYASYVAANWTDFIGQTMLHAERLRLTDPRFYVSNLLNEWRRFEWLLDSPRDVVGAWTVVLAIPLAFVAGARLLRAGNRLALVSVVAAFLSLALLDSTKARLYASLLVPVLCFGLAVALTPALLALRGTALTRLRVGAACAFLIWIVVDGLGGYRFVAEERLRVSPYSDVGQRMAASLEGQVQVLGSERWWWALHPRPYRSLRAQWEIWQVEQHAGHGPDFARTIESFNGTYLILDNDTRGDLTRVPSRLRQQVNGVLSNQAARVAGWSDPTYGVIEIYRFE